MAKPPDLESHPTHPSLPNKTPSKASQEEHKDEDPTKADVDPSTAVVVVVDFEPSDGGNPRNWRGSIKWAINLGSALGMMTSTFQIAAYASGIGDEMEFDLGVGRLLLVLGQTTYLLGMGVGSLIFPPLGGIFGRKRVLVPTYGMTCLFTMGVALASNIETVLICRFFAGVAGAASQVLVPASVQSLYTPQEMAVPFVTAAIAPFLGPVLGPLIGNYVVQYTGNWRIINWVMMAFSGFAGLIYLAVPETYQPFILRQRAKKLTKETGKLHVSMYDLQMGGEQKLGKEIVAYLKNPIKYLLTEPILLVLTLYIAILYGILNLFFTAFPYIYRGQRGWSLGNSGLPFLGLCVGFVLSVPITGLCAKPYQRVLREEGKVAPELRLYFAMISAVLLPISLFWVGWSASPRIHWIVPVLGGVVFGFGQIGLTLSAMTYLADVYGVKVSVAFSGFNFIRFLVASVFPLFALQMYQKLGSGWASSVLGFILLAFLPAPFLFYKYGPWIRARSPVARG